MIELHLNLAESCELEIELFAEIADLRFDGREYGGSARRRTRRPALAPCPVLAFWPARTRLLCRVAGFYANARPVCFVCVLSRASA